MLRAYCDCSKKGESIAITAIVVTGKTFIDYELRTLPDVKWTAHGELRAIQLAFELINKNFDTPQIVTVYSDCLSIVDQYSTTLEKNFEVPQNRAYYSDWVKLVEMSREHSVKIRYVRGHEKARTYHTICDYAARAII